jgi:hypothetical protein
MRIFIRTLSGFKDFGINVEPYYSIGAIKKQIELLTGYQCKIQILIFDRFVLEDKNQLSDFDIQDNYTIVLVLKEQQYTQFVTISCSNSRRIRVGVKPTFTGEDLKCLIQLELGFPAQMQRLVYDGKLITDNSISSLDLTKEEYIHLIISQRGN